MKKTGFTLVELLAVITILAITVTIVIVKVDKNIKDANDFGNDMQIESIESAALIYVEESNSPNLKEKKVDQITINTLIDKGLIEEKKIKNISKTDIVIVANINNNLKAKYTKTSKNAIFLVGPAEISIYKGDTYKEMGAFVAIPNVGIEELTQSNITSNVNTSSVGEYKVTYSYDNALSQERKVSVITE